jgi:PAS domain S-box-containing protein
MSSDEHAEAPVSREAESGARPRSSAPPAAAGPDAAIETALYALAARQAVLAELGVLALGAKSFQEIIDEAVASIRATLDVDACGVLELLPGGESLIVRADAGWPRSVKGRLVDAGRGSQAGYTLLSSEPVVVEDMAKETRFTVSPIPVEHHVQSGMSVIIHGRGRPWGVFSAMHRERRRFTREEVDYFRAAANVIALAAERFQTEAGLRLSEESFRSLIEHAPEGVLITRGDSIVYVNRALWGCLGYEGPEGLLGTRALDIVHPEDRPQFERRLRLLQDSSSPEPAAETRLLRRDGAAVLTESSGVPIVWNGQRSVAALVRDVTERRKIEARLQQSERLSSLGVLAAGVAHEINNPLMYVLGNLDLARSELGSLCGAASATGGGAAPEARGALAPAALEAVRDVADLLDKAVDGGESVRRIVADLKAFSRTPGEEDRAPIDVRKVMASAVDIARNEIRHRAQLVVDEGAVPRVMASDTRLGQVFLNLLLNAAHAIPEGAAQSHRITVRIQPGAPGWVRVEVQDTGAGIPPEVQGRLFDPFYTTKPQGMGTGLGLAICPEIVAALGGEITVESEVGRGACFRVVLPAAPDAAVPCEARCPGEAAEAAPRPRGRVLIIDDEPFIAGLCQRLLAAEHDVEIATTAKAALSCIEASREPDVILCDLMMPEMSGMELFEIVERRCPALAPRFVFFSGGAFTPAARSFRERLSNPFLDKPCPPALLRDTVRERVLAARAR